MTFEFLYPIITHARVKHKQPFTIWYCVDNFYSWKDIVGKKVSKLRSIAELRAFDCITLIYFYVLSQYFSAALQIWLGRRMEHREYWMIYRGPAFSRSYNLVPDQEKPIHPWVRARAWKIRTQKRFFQLHAFSTIVIMSEKALTKIETWPIVILRHVKIHTYRVHSMRTRFDRKSIKTLCRKCAKSFTRKNPRMFLHQSHQKGLEWKAKHCLQQWSTLSSWRISSRSFNSQLSA